MIDRAADSIRDAAMRPATSVQSRLTIGALQMCTGMLIIRFLTSLQLLGATHGPFEITFWRFFMQSALMPFVITLGSGRCRRNPCAAGNPRPASVCDSFLLSR